jgi:hypothetical protein
VKTGSGCSGRVKAGNFNTVKYLQVCECEIHTFKSRELLFPDKKSNTKALRTSPRRYLHYISILFGTVFISSKIQYHKKNPIPSLSSISPLYFDPFSQCPFSNGSPVPTLLKSSILPNPKTFPIPIHITVPQAPFPTVTIIALPISF